jgi:hypothetical protein
MKSTTILLIFIYLSNTIFAQSKTIAGTYAISSVKLDNGLLLTQNNKDSIIQVKIAATFDGIKNGGNPITRQDSSEVTATQSAILNKIMSVTLILKTDGKFSKYMIDTPTGKKDIIESGNYIYNVKTKIIKFISKISNENPGKQVVEYDAKTKSIHYIAGKDEADAGETIVQFMKVK